MAKLKAKVDKKNAAKEKDELKEPTNMDGDTGAESSSEEHAGVKKSGRGKKVVETEGASADTDVKEENADETEANTANDEQAVVNGSSKTNGGSKTSANNEESSDATEATKGKTRAGKATPAKTKKSKTDSQDATENSSPEPEPENSTADDKPLTVNSTSGKKGKQYRKAATKQQKEKQSKNEAYEVEDIIEMRTDKSGGKEFLVKWKGYKKSDSTWEPEDNLSCKDLIQAFNKKTESAATPTASRKRPSRSPVSKAKKAKTEGKGKPDSRAASKSSKSAEGQKKSDNAEYEVEEILDVAVKKGKKEFLIKWKGYTKSENSWEPETNLSCKHLIEEFYEKIEKGENDSPKPKQTAKSKGQKNKENDAAAQEEYEVEKIIDMKTDKKGKKEFQIRWKGYGKDEDTWETENDLSCKDLIDAFMASIKTEKTKGTPAKAAAAKKGRNKKK